MEGAPTVLHPLRVNTWTVPSKRFMRDVYVSSPRWTVPACHCVGQTKTANSDNASSDTAAASSKGFRIRQKMRQGQGAVKDYAR